MSSITPSQIAKAINDLVAERDDLLALVEYLQGKPKNNVKKLTKNEAVQIRNLKRSGMSQKDLADAYDVNPATISRIVRGIYH